MRSAIHYTDFIHLAPVCIGIAMTGIAMTGTGLLLARPYVCAKVSGAQRVEAALSGRSGRLPDFSVPATGY